SAEVVRRLAGHELLREGPVAILYGDGGGAEVMAELTSAVRELAGKVDGRLMPLYRGTNERGALAAGLAAGPADALEGCEDVLCDLGQRLGVRETSFTGMFQVQRAAAAAVPAFAALADPPAPDLAPGPTLLGPARP